MSTVIEVDSLSDIYAHEKLSFPKIANNLAIEYYCYDDRIGWETHIVTSEGYGVLGFANGDLR